MDRIRMGAHAMGAMGLRTSMAGAVRSLRSLEYPRSRPRGTAITNATANPSRKVVMEDPTYPQTDAP